MGQRKIAFAEHEFYHLYNRGNSKQEIFRTNADRNRFILQLYAANSSKSFNLREIDQSEVFTYERGELLVYIGAYCLMPNHFHLLVTPAKENGVQLFMQKLSTGYSMYFNKKYGRTGALFEGRFKSQHVDGDEYLKYLYSYIHLNPIKLIDSEWKERGIEDSRAALSYLESYRFSSLADYMHQRAEGAILSKDAFPDFYQNANIQSELFEWLTYNPNKAANTLSDVKVTP